MISKAEAVKRWRRNAKEKAVLAFGSKCAICSYDKCIASFDFHHLNPKEKEFSFAQVTKSPKSWDVIQEELKKCVMLCANCHREVHFLNIELEGRGLQRFDEEKIPDKEFKKDLMNNCPICGKEKNVTLITCSITCSRIKQYKVDWREWDNKLQAMKETMSYVAIGKEIGVSDVTVKKRMKTLKLI